MSVIIPTYNRAKLLNISINSVLSQTYRDFELIVIDDCSKDTTSAVLDGIADKRLRVIKNTSNKGIAAVRNIGVTLSRGRYIAFLDDDDEWLPDKLEKQIDVLDRGTTSLGCVYTGSLVVDSADDHVLQTSIPLYRNNVLKEMLFQNFITTSTIALKKACFDKVGLFDEGIPYGEDYDMWIRIAEEYEYDFVKEPLAKYRSHQTAMTKNYVTVINGVERILSKHRKLFASDKRAYSNHMLLLGVTYCYLGRTKDGIKTFVRAIRAYQFDARLYYNLALALLGTETFIKLKEAKTRYFPQRIKA
ncbi:MAG: glycosyltransferase [Thermodesulfobacteriota bacterium]